MLWDRNSFKSTAISSPLQASVLISSYNFFHIKRVPVTISLNRVTSKKSNFYSGIIYSSIIVAYIRENNTIFGVREILSSD